MDPLALRALQTSAHKGENDQVFATCSLCDFMIFLQVRAEIVHMNGLNNFIVRGNVAQHT